MVAGGRYRFLGRRRATALLAVVVLWVATACGPEAEPPPAAPEPAKPAAPAPPAPAPDAGAGAEQAATEIFKTRCVTCHGAQGAGDGPGSQGLEPKPRNFQDPAWQAEVSDEHLQNIILYGGAAVGKSPTMPSNPDLGGKPEVAAALVQYIRRLGSS